jgi:branched-chain amino acid transport system substrate-binding protein
MQRRDFLAAACAAIVLAPAGTFAADTIKVGFPMILSGPGALFGEPALKGAQMYVDEVNGKGGVLGRKIELLPRDTKGNADEAVRHARELILREEVHFIVGTLTSAEGPAVSTIAKENEIVFIAPIPKTDQLTAKENVHPYVFRTASTTGIEGASAAEIVAKWPNVKRVGTISPDYAYGQDATKSFVAHLKKIKPDVEIVDQQWPKLGEQDYTPFINAQLAAKPDAVFSSLWGGHFVTFAKQAKPLGYFDQVKGFIGVGEAGSIESARAMGADYPFGIWGNTYDVMDWPDGPPAHKEYIDRIVKYTGQNPPSSWPITGYVAMQVLVAAIEKAGSIESKKVSAALEGLTVDTPVGPQTLRKDDHQANRGQFWGKMVKSDKHPFAVMEDVTYIDPSPFMN